MGGISMATAAGTGLAAMNLLNDTRKNNQHMKYLRQDQQATAAKRKNLLNQQLATRRAGLGAMGITSSKSSAAVQQRLARETYDDIAEDETDYKRRYAGLQQQNSNNLFNTALSAAGKLIK